MKQLRINHVPHQCLAIDKITIIKGCRFCQRYIYIPRYIYTKVYIDAANLFANFLGIALNAKLKMIALSRIPDH